MGEQQEITVRNLMAVLQSFDPPNESPIVVRGYNTDTQRVELEPVLGISVESWHDGTARLVVETLGPDENF